MRYPIKDKFWGWQMDPFEVFAYWDSRRTSPNWHWHWHCTQHCVPDTFFIMLMTTSFFFPKN